MGDIRGIIGVDLAPQEACQLCTKMQLGPASYLPDKDAIQVCRGRHIGSLGSRCRHLVVVCLFLV